MNITTLLEAEKAFDIKHIDLRGRTEIADHLVIASGRIQRHLVAMADILAENLKKDGYFVSIEGRHAEGWVLLDAGDVVVHLFRPETRAFYAIERLWGETVPDAEKALPDQSLAV